MFGDIFNQVQQVGGDLQSKWKDWIQQPGNRAFLVNAGLQMLQPVQPGQSPIGNIGQALGQGFEAKRRVESDQQATENTNYQRDTSEQTRQDRLAQQRIENAQKTRQLDIYDKNATSLANSRSLTGMFGKVGLKNQDQFESWVQRAALAAAKAENDNAFLSGDPNFVPKSPEEFMNDPNWMTAQQKAWQSIPQLSGTQPAPGVTSSTAVPSATAQPIPKPTGTTQTKYPDGYVTPDGMYRKVTVNGRVGWQKLK